jgi:hypothetical protein
MESHFLAVARAAGKDLSAAPARDFASPNHVRTAALALPSTTPHHRPCFSALAQPATRASRVENIRLNLAIPGLVRTVARVPTAAMESHFVVVAQVAGRALPAATARDFASPNHVRTVAPAFPTTTQLHQPCIHALALPATRALHAASGPPNLVIPILARMAAHAPTPEMESHIHALVLLAGPALPAPLA